MAGAMLTGSAWRCAFVLVLERVEAHWDFRLTDHLGGLGWMPQPHREAFLGCGNFVPSVTELA